MLLSPVSMESHHVSHRTPTHVVRHGEEKRSCSPSGLAERGPGKFHPNLLTLTCNLLHVLQGGKPDKLQAIFGLFEGPNLVAYTMSETWLFRVISSLLFVQKHPGVTCIPRGLVFSTYPCRSLSEKDH